MKAYRIKREKYSRQLTGEGAQKYGGRWNRVGTQMIYTSEHASLAALEVLVHVNSDVIPSDYKLLEIEIPDDIISLKKMPIENLPRNWRDYKPPDELAEIGTNWAESNVLLCLLVPSRIVPTEYNILINPNHEDFDKVIIADERDFRFDKRLRS